MAFFKWTGKLKKTGKVQAFSTNHPGIETVEEMESHAAVHFPGVEWQGGEEIDADEYHGRPKSQVPASASEHGIKAAMVRAVTNASVGGAAHQPGTGDTAAAQNKAAQDQATAGKAAVDPNAKPGT